MNKSCKMLNFSSLAAIYAQLSYPQGTSGFSNLANASFYNKPHVESNFEYWKKALAFVNYRVLSIYCF